MIRWPSNKYNNYEMLTKKKSPKIRNVCFWRFIHKNNTVLNNSREKELAKTGIVESKIKS